MILIHRIKIRIIWKLIRKNIRERKREKEERIETKKNWYWIKIRIKSRLKIQILACSKSFYFPSCFLLFFLLPRYLDPSRRIHFGTRSLGSLVALFGNPRRSRSPPIYASTLLLLLLLLPRSDHFCSFHKPFWSSPILFLFFCVPFARTHTRLPLYAICSLWAGTRESSSWISLASILRSPLTAIERRWLDSNFAIKNFFKNLKLFKNLGSCICRILKPCSFHDNSLSYLGNFNKESIGFKYF